MGDAGPAVPRSDDLRRVPPSSPLERYDGYDLVFRTHHADLLGIARLLCAGDEHRAEEVTAEAFAKVFPHWRAGRVLDERAYLRRAVLNEVRGRGRRAAAGLRAEIRRGPLGEVAAPADAAVDRAMLVAALGQLPARQRATVVLRFYLDLSEADAAALLGMRVGTVKSQTSRGLARLRHLLGGPS